MPQTPVQSSSRTPKPAVVEGAKVVPPKESFGSKIKKTFINDNINLKGYIINNVLIPTVQNTFFSIVMNSISMIFKRPQGGGYYPPMGGYNPGWPPVSSNPYGVMAQPNQSINYGQYASPYQNTAANPLAARAIPPMIKPTDVQIPTEDLAIKALGQLQDIIQSDGRLNLRQFFEVVGVKGNGYTDEYWGWVDLLGVNVKHHYAGGYYIDMPKAAWLAR